MKCKNWERRNRGPRLLVTADRALAPDAVEAAMAHLQKSLHLPVVWMTTEGVKCTAVVVDPRSRPC